MVKNKKNHKSSAIFIWVIMPILAIGLSSFAVFRGVENYITTSHYFNVQDVKAEGIEDVRYLNLIKQELLGVNIFKVNTENLAARIRSKFPTFYSVVITRILPSQLYVVAKERRPVALLKRDFYYLLDSDGVVLGVYPLNSALNFPVIAGMENSLSRLKVGANYAGNLGHALSLARVLRIHKNAIENSFPPEGKKYITKIVADNPGNMSFFLGDEIEVKINEKNLDEKVSFLPSIIRTIGSEIILVKYIDLRPKEPVVASKNSKLKK